MSTLITARIETLDDATTFEVVRRLESGERAGSLEGSPLDLIASMARVGLGPSGSEGPTLIHGETAHPRLSRSSLEGTFAGLFPGSSRPDRLSMIAGLLQILDAWDDSHTAAQEADDLGENVNAPYWHFIAHRREPDPGNAQYWARRVARHPILPELAHLAQPVLEAQGDPGLTARLLAGETWNPSALIDLCTRSKPGSATSTLARRLQRLEMLTLLEATASRLIIG